MSKNGPAKANKTSIATASDSVQTPVHIAKSIVEHFKPFGVVLEPCRGKGNIYALLPKGREWCEILERRDFFLRRKKADWIITNPPYSIYDKFLEHCFEIADNVVLLVPLQKAFKSEKNQKLVDSYGGLKEILIIGGGGKCGFAFGFLTGCLHYQRGYKGPIKRSWLKESTAREDDAVVS